MIFFDRGDRIVTETDSGRNTPYQVLGRVNEFNSLRRAGHPYISSGIFYYIIGCISQQTLFLTSMFRNAMNKIQFIETTVTGYSDFATYITDGLNRVVNIDTCLFIQLKG